MHNHLKCNIQWISPAFQTLFLSSLMVKSFKRENHFATSAAHAYNVVMSTSAADREMSGKDVIDHYSNGKNPTGSVLKGSSRAFSEIG